MIQSVNSLGQVIIAKDGGVGGLDVSLHGQVLYEVLGGLGYEVQGFLSDRLHVRTAFHDHFDPLCGQHEV